MRALDSIASSGRSLLRAPGFAVTAVLTLALGIGLSTAVFTVADALLLRKLPVRDQDQLVTMWADTRDGSVDHWPLTVTQAHDFARSSRVAQSVAYVDFYGSTPIPVLDRGSVTRLRRALVSGNYFDVLGAHAVVGRTLQPMDDRVGAAPVVVISYATWQRRFGADPGVVGKQIALQFDGVSYTIVGVMPAGLEYPLGVDFWGPYAPARLGTASDSSYAALDLVARLAAGATPAAARSELSALLTRAASAGSRDLRAVAHRLPLVMLGDARPAVLVFTAAAALLLLITCIDVANLLLVRGLARVREMAVRSALGAARSQVVAQLLTENAMLALVGGALGTLLAAGAVASFLAFAPANVPLLDTVRLDGAALAAALGITGVAMLLFGLAPALITARGGAQEVLRSGMRQSVSRGSRIAREVLVASQVALAVLVLSGAGLLGRSFMKLQHVALAFDSSHLLVAELGLRYDRYDTMDKQLAMLRALLAQLRGTPGVEAASPVVAVPFSGTDGWTGSARKEGQSRVDAAKNAMFNMEVVTPDYFQTFGLRLLRGRALTDADHRGAEPVVVISEATARAYWPNEDPIGKRLVVGDGPEQGVTVVGIVPDTRYRDLRDAVASVYFPLAQSTFPFAPTTLAIRASGSPAALVPAIRRVVADVAPGVVLVNAASFENYMAGPLAQPRLNAFLLGVFALAAVALAAIGLFGVMATMVRQRTRELGIRMALGATAGDVQLMVVARGVVIAGVGIAAGLAGAIVANRLLSALLYDVSATDLITLGGVGLLLVIIALIASFVPARSSARIDPVVALRADG